MNCDNNIHLEKINMFNKPSDWTRNDWIHSEARKILTWMPRKTVKWINKEDMSAFEKKNNTLNMKQLKVAQNAFARQMYKLGGMH